jgi:hypothetical protein
VARRCSSLLVAAALASSGCRDARPWEQPTDGAVTVPPAPLLGEPPSSFLPPPSSSSEPSATAAPSGDAPAPTASAEPSPTPPVRVGGPWVRCYGGFHPSGEPLKDVTRLSLLCGPENGMRRLSKKAMEGLVAEGGPAVTETFEARRGECYRVFAVAEPSVADLDVVVRSSRGVPVAADHGEDPWPIVQPDRPFCPRDDDRYSVEVSARRGHGRFAGEVWVLRTPRAHEPGRERAGPD